MQEQIEYIKKILKDKKIENIYLFDVDFGMIKQFNGYRMQNCSTLLAKKYCKIGVKI